MLIVCSTLLSKCVPLSNNVFCCLFYPLSKMCSTVQYSIYAVLPQDIFTLYFAWHINKKLCSTVQLCTVYCASVLNVTFQQGHMTATHRMSCHGNRQWCHCRGSDHVMWVSNFFNSHLILFWHNMFKSSWKSPFIHKNSWKPCEGILGKPSLLSTTGM